jgi:hypothetical protein
MGTPPDAGQYGAFYVPSPESGWMLSIIATDGTDDAVSEARGWEHVSVNAINGKRSRCPSWKEMCFVKDLFWDPEDVVMQLHPRKSEYVNNHPSVLHLWRPTHVDIPTPSSLLVGIK